MHRRFTCVRTSLRQSPVISTLATVIWPLFEKLFEEGSGLRYLEEVLYYLFKASSRLKGRGSGSASEKPAQL